LANDFHPKEGHLVALWGFLFETPESKFKKNFTSILEAGGKDSFDVVAGGDTSELLYEVSGSTQSQSIKFTRASHNAMDIEYSENIYPYR